MIIGTGWAGNVLARRLNKSLYDVRVISPSNHFLFTPLLPSTAVGTLEFRAIQEPVRTIAGLGEYYQAKAREIDKERKVVLCEDLFKGHKFEVKFDYLCVAAGNKTNTFNTPGVAEREGHEVFFLKHLYHARQIRNRVLECFERASNPNISEFEIKRLLSFIVVGGGPTSCEFTTELYDFLQSDVSKWYPDLMKHVKVTLVEAGPGLLGSFDKALADYYLDSLRKKDIDVRVSTAVVGIEESYIDAETTGNKSGEKENGSHYTLAKLADGSDLPFGMMVWSAGLAPVKLIERADLDLERGHVVVDEYLRVPGQKGRIFALGDCATLTSGPLPPTASVAEQQAYYLGDAFNNYYSKFTLLDDSSTEVPLPGPIAPAVMPLESLAFVNKILFKSSPKFQYKNRGSMASMGLGGGVSDLTHSNLPVPKTTISGFAANVMWRSTYLTKQLSWTNMMLIPMYWFKAIVFGRDISRF